MLRAETSNETHMPLIIICGLPSSGKTYRAKQLAIYFEARINGSIPGNESNGASIAVEGEGGVEVAAHAATQLSALNLERAMMTTPSLSTPVGARGNDSPSIPSAKLTRKLIDKVGLAKSPSNRQLRVHHISDHSCHLPRSIYASGAAKLEKDGRATLYSATKRVLSKGDIVILDSGNYIKGWRYQLHCEAKNLGTGSCVVQIGVPVEKCQEVNRERLQHAKDCDAKSGSERARSEVVETSDGLSTDEIDGDTETDPYSATVFEELAMRFEEPNPMARWDSPLFAVPWDDFEPPGDAIWRELIDSVGKDGRTKVVRPNQAAAAPPASSSSHLYELDRTTQFILSRIQDHQRENPDSGGGELFIALPTDQPSGIVSKTVSLALPTTSLTVPQLQRLRRQFIGLHRQQMGASGAGAVGSAGGGLGKERVGELFVGFLESHWGTR